MGKVQKEQVDLLINIAYSNVVSQSLQAEIQSHGCGLREHFRGTSASVIPIPSGNGEVVVRK